MSAVPQDFFGLHIRWAATRTPWPTVRFSGWRVISAETVWFGLQPRRDLWRFELLDKSVQLAERNGVDVMVTLGMPPRWASARPDELAPNGPGTAAPPRDLADWERYVAALASRYKTRVRFYEIWNEPKFADVDGRLSRTANFTGTSAQMAELSAIAHRVIKQNDPNAILLSPAFDGEGGGVARLEAFLRAGGGRFVDGISFHFYVWPEDLPALVAQLRKVLGTYGFKHLPIYNTESGYLIESQEMRVAPQGSGVFGRVLKLTEAPGYVARSLILAAASGIQRTYWYSWDVPAMSMTHSRGAHITAAGEAYRTVQEWLHGTTISDCSRQQGTAYSCRLTRDGKHAWVAWSVGSPKNWAFPQAWRIVQTESIGGERLRVEEGTVRLSTEPLLMKPTFEAW
jgi:hypothetical protein